MPVHPPRIPKGEVVHDHRQGDGGNLDNKMRTICHPAKGMDPMTKPGDVVGEQRRQMFQNLIAAEDRLAPVAPSHDMIEATWQMNAWFSCHAGRDRRRSSQCQIVKAWHHFSHQFRAVRTQARVNPSRRG
jgi:hypothetical protein